jgi:hypothetical protein
METIHPHLTRRGSTMSDKHETLVVATRTAEHPGLAEALRRRAGGRGTRFTLLVPALPSDTGEGNLAAGWLEAMAVAGRAQKQLRVAGLEVGETIVGDADCAAALGDALHARDFDDVLLATPQWVGSGESKLKLQVITNTPLRFRSPRLGAFLRGGRLAGVTMDSRKTASRCRDDERTRTSPSAPAPAGVALRSSS